MLGIIHTGSFILVSLKDLHVHVHVYRVHVLLYIGTSIYMCRYTRVYPGYVALLFPVKIGKNLLRMYVHLLFPKRTNHSPHIVCPSVHAIYAAMDFQ